MVSHATTPPSIFALVLTLGVGACVDTAEPLGDELTDLDVLEEAQPDRLAPPGETDETGEADDAPVLPLRLATWLDDSVTLDDVSKSEWALTEASFDHGTRQALADAQIDPEIAFIETALARARARLLPERLAAASFTTEDVALLAGSCKCNGKTGTLCGTGGNDGGLVGGGGADVINGRGGNDVIIGGGGNDRLCGSAGNDVIRGSSGNDKIYGGSGHDNLRGDGGNDLVHGGGGNDLVRGDGGTDTLLGSSGNDRLFGIHVVTNPGTSQFGPEGRAYGPLSWDWRQRDILRGGTGDDVLYYNTLPALATPPGGGGDGTTPDFDDIDGQGGHDTCWQGSSGGSVLNAIIAGAQFGCEGPPYAL
ncbi:MAG: hypothetical protein K0V04_24720 [Deltaproteobacteria bacterium]|nr:hypothetical protein [Deltaproteobacteria bacterium]